MTNNFSPNSRFGNTKGLSVKTKKSGRVRRKCAPLAFTSTRLDDDFVHEHDDTFLTRVFVIHSVRDTELLLIRG